MIRRLRGSMWQSAIPGRDYAVESYEEPSMSVQYLLPEALLTPPGSAQARVVVGRITDRGSGMHGGT